MALDLGLYNYNNKNDFLIKNCFNIYFFHLVIDPSSNDDVLWAEFTKTLASSSF